ncbi:MAG: DUF1275 family protein [Phycisphaeraceae bacterium]|nr:DUF1275 family protein [Phycisphaeraceae bacterium]
MFIAQAHSLAQQARLSVTLAWIAGYTNMVALLTCGHVVAHVTGTTSEIGRFASLGQWGGVGVALVLVLAFLIGAMGAGFTTELGRRRGWESIYVLPMAIEALLLLVFALAIQLLDLDQTRAGHATDAAVLLLAASVGSAAMGLQNATITRISSGVVRTTHVTGVVTDLGLELVHVIWGVRDHKGEPAPPEMRRLVGNLLVPAATWRALLLATIFLSFAVGVATAALIHAHVAPRYAMYLPVLLLLWVIVQDAVVPIAEIEPSDLVELAGLALPPGIAVYQLDREERRRGRVHRLPNLLAWADRVPATARVVVLDLNDAAQVDDNAALELRALIHRLHKEDRRLVLSGVSRERYKQLAEAGGPGAEALDARAVCSDLELAIARGLNMLERTLEPNPTRRGAGMTNAGI